ncbi:3-isopropylmalate dehydrogenase [Helicobacter trogontum]|uniref:3-isopropylmalate dehydrogenase n=1 Tax=Helicobacter trogontum TaxID=50960 RepID=A0A4U8TJ31_9HELI|nr:3-isopropylmalate dehydrogenase [Helicobacter trogontum]MCI5786586.1 3-isopropylmalate dehydrogenase [Helicobacter trogontum]MDY5184497.1 3-isopropylmalate dehydrogenase [Helicobacter trogontum]TLD99734.1 3-isopropylmalate dehydrogenase [Helicobacter trogontum]
MQKQIAVIYGDGIGREVVTQALKVLDSVAKIYKHEFVYNEVLAGGCAIDACGDCLPQESLEICKRSDSVLLGAVGGPKWDKQPSHNRPESALLKLRKELGVFANIRPATLLSELSMASPLKCEILQKGIDFVIVRELVGGAYFGRHLLEERDGEKIAIDEMSYTQSQIESIAKVAFQIAQKRGKNLVSVDKANVLSSSRLWREVVEMVAKDYPSVALSHMYVDNAAMQICRDPSQFDVILTENMFGDILSDEASIITGTIGVIPSASLSHNTLGLYEPIHGSAPDIAGQDKANPIGTILSVAMMLELSFGLKKEAESVRNAVNKALQQGYRTGDMMDKDSKLVGCEKMGDIISEFVS